MIEHRLVSVPKLFFARSLFGVVIDSRFSDNLNLSQCSGDATSRIQVAGTCIVVSSK